MRTRTAASALMGLAVIAAACLALASPASAHDGHDHTSVGPNAVNNSTSSGEAVAINDSTASGDAVAINGSVASGCSTAINDSTASGGDCKPHKVHHAKKHHGHDVPAASVATPVAARNLAFTGTSTGPLALFGAGLLLVGAALVAGSRRGLAAGR